MGQHMLLNVHGSEFYLFNFTEFFCFCFFQKMCDLDTPTQRVSPVSDMTSGSTALARSLTLKFEF